MLRVSNVTKSFDTYASPGERFFRLFVPHQDDSHRFHALRNVSFEIERGTALGLLGRNGAGKSTLMQIIANTLTPSAGSVETVGRISPLLELGTGFNPEYTGIDNVRLNAAILGLSKEQIAEKEHLIAEFADIGDFLHRPVKTYSSGMFARLAFSVAIHVEPEILLVDEILAVGDMGFQQKCVNKLRKMRQDGLTLLFVSHSPDAVKSICDKGLFLDRGMIRYYGPADLAVDQYLAFIREETNREQMTDQEAHPWSRPVDRDRDLNAKLRYGSGHVQIVGARTLNRQGEEQSVFQFGETVTLEIEIESKIEVEDLCVNFLFRDATGIDMFGTSTFDEHVALQRMCPGETQLVRFSFPALVRIGGYGAVVSVTKVTRRDSSDVFLFDQAEGITAFSIIADPKRPVHYKMHVDTEIDIVSPGAAAMVNAS